MLTDATSAREPSPRTAEEADRLVPPAPRSDFERPRLLAAIEGVAKRRLRLEHGANYGPLLHIVLYAGLFSLALTSDWPLSGPVPLIVTLVLLHLLNYSLTIGINHMHAHRPLFTVGWPNRLVGLACCFPSTVSAAEMRTVHVQNHHKYDDGPGDVTSTIGYERGWRALWYWGKYGALVKRQTLKKVFGADAPAVRRRKRPEVAIDLGVVVAASAALTWFLPGRMLLFYWVPLLVTHLTSGYFAWLTHAPAQHLDDASGSINTVSNVLNFFIFNQGYHSIHHRYPGIHWTEIPDRLPYMLEVETEVIVPYWVTLNTSWRIARPERFLDRTHGERWRARLERRLADGTYRRRFLPYFVRV